MKRKIISTGLIILVVGLVAFGAYRLASAKAAELPLNPAGQADNFNRSAVVDSSTATLPAPSELSGAEADALRFIREEEKLAHDVYVVLYEKWGLPVFQNISQSESAHTQAVLTLLERYNLADPASTQPGVFTDPTLQSLYTQLVAQGSLSLDEALKVGAAIEELDLLDLQARLAAIDNADIQQVFTNLLRGSENHLRSFVATYERQTGQTYQPQHLTLEAYQAIQNAGWRGFGAGAQGGASGGATQSGGYGQGNVTSGTGQAGSNGQGFRGGQGAQRGRWGQVGQGGQNTAGALLPTPVP